MKHCFILIVFTFLPLASGVSLVAPIGNGSSGDNDYMASTTDRMTSYTNRIQGRAKAIRLAF